MNDIFLQFHFLGQPVIVTGWKLVGYAGVLTFAGRWFVQVGASHLRNRSYMPHMFWYMSLVGSILLLVYFTFDRSDSVGILSNLFPFLVAAYNLRLDARHRRATLPPACGARGVGSVRGATVPPCTSP